MPALSIRGALATVVRSLKALAEWPCWSEARRRSVLDEIEAAWSRQTRRPTADEVNEWIAAGR